MYTLKFFSITEESEQQQQQQNLCFWLDEQTAWLARIWRYVI